MSITEQFKGLPMEDLIGAPLVAAANAQGKLAKLTQTFIEQVGIDQQTNQLRQVNLTYDKRTKSAKPEEQIQTKT